jgi:capsular exopolysaccharide synthesis family protein
MSRIYKALKKLDASERNSLVQLIDGDQETHSSPGSNSGITLAPSTLPTVSQELPPTRPTNSGMDYRVVPLRIPAGAPILPFDGTDVKVAEQYRMLRTNLLQHPDRPRLVAVTSATSGDGKTLTAINLAATLALKGDLRVLIVDADMRRPSMADALGIEAKPGLGQVLRGECLLRDAIVRVQQLPSLHVLPALREVLNPAELLDSSRCRAAFAELIQQFSYVIVDTTPVAAVADFKLIHQLCDGTLMVVRPDNTKRVAFLHAMQVELKSKLLGVVVNAYSDWFLWRSQGEDYKYYGQSAPI